MHEVAEELGLEPSQLMRMLREMDIPVRSHMSTVDPTHVARLRTMIERERRGTKTTSAKSAPTLRRRRRVRRSKPVPAEEPEAIAEIDSTTVEEGLQEEPVAEEDLAEPVVEEVVVAEATDAAEEVPVDEEVEVVDPPDKTPPAEVVNPEPLLETSSAEEEVSTEESAELEPDKDDSAGEVVELEVDLAQTSDAKAAPKPVRRGMPTPPPPPKESTPPKASAAPGGTVRITAEGLSLIHI